MDAGANRPRASVLARSNQGPVRGTTIRVTRRTASPVGRKRRRVIYYKTNGSLMGTFGLLTIPLVMFVFFALMGLELMGEEIEEPFGLDCNDLPTGDIAATISENVFELLAGQSCKGKHMHHELYDKVF
ncbi:MAG: hypothetical protein KDA24_11115 [Deltaproteobacteria bacterium]|nr:hypothetical protein [Deltaproteobacteria bacterium]